jgi:hypothetical protein
MKQKRNPKLKVEEIYRQLKLDAENLLGAWGLSPDEIQPRSRAWTEIHFAPDNPQTPHAGKSLRVLEQDGYITIHGGFLNVLHSSEGKHLTARIHINRDRLHLPSRWQRFKNWLGSL